MKADGLNSSYPFTTLTESSPYSRLLDARILSDTGAEICRASILLQKDRYSLMDNELWPVTNVDIENAWNKAFLTRGDLLLAMNEQVEEGRLLPFQSLFFCRQTNRFFHPICPKCAFPLKLCKTDDRLIYFHLQAYARSLKRYLYCPCCEGGSDFYVFEREDSDPPELKDRWGLIKDFGQILKGGKNPNGFPCMECNEQELCYNGEYLALSRIIPFSFYPFYMLVLKPVSVSSTDFLNLVSGASLEELEAKHHRDRREGRAECLSFLRLQSTKTNFLFETGENHFLEVLYLKLAFLAEVSDMIFSGDWESRYPDPGFTTERLWVSLSEQNGHLPYLWNFQTRLIDPVADFLGPTPFTAKPPSSDGIQFLGRLWFYSIIMNKRQDISKVNELVSKEMENRISKGGPSENSLGAMLREALSPKNIFWEPRDHSFTEKSRWLWKRTVDLGISLLMAGAGRHQSWSSEKFRQDFRLLRDAIKETLFHPPPAAQPIVHAEEDKAISELIGRIMGSWREGLDGKDEPQPGCDVEGEEGGTKIYKSPHPDPGVRKSESRNGHPLKADSEEDWEDKNTLILSIKDFPQVVRSHLEEEEENLPKTLTRGASASLKAGVPHPQSHSSASSGDKNNP